jgi:quinol monooxygenase YgiN
MNYNWSDPRTLRVAAARRGGAVCLVARAETLAGADEDFERRLSDFAAQVRANEAGCLSYVATRAMGTQAHFAVHARFSSWQAFRRHADTPHMNEALPGLTGLLVSAVSLEIFLEV